MDEPETASVRVRPARGETRALVLVLYGGRAESRAASRPRHLSAVRLVPFARDLHHRLSQADVGAAVWTLRYRMRGWNGAEASPVADARWALAEIRRVHGDVPVVLVGHSMGGRAALRVADDPCVVAVVALAPWLPPGEPRVTLGSRRLLVVHGTADRWTDPAASQAYVEAAAAEGTPASWVPMPGHGHFMFRTPGRWRALAGEFVVECLEAALGQAGEPPAPNLPHHA